MSHRHVMVTRSAKLSCRNNQLVVRQEDESSGETCEYTIPLEDIRTLMLEDRQSIITSALLARLAEFRIAVFTCDEKHLPNGVLLPYCQHSRGPKIMQSQLEMKRPLVKRLWQAVVRRKIENQAACLTLCGCSGDEALLALAGRVASGDKGSIESQAARMYFKHLFGKAFKRSSDDFINSAMNYGYALIRGQVARSLCAFGFQPSIGLQHHSELNNFNLADDLMEPYRPIVDYVVASELDVDSPILSKLHKRRLMQILTQMVWLENERYDLTASIEAMVSSFSNAISTEDPSALQLPRLTEVQMGVYE
ncbi:CRISPR-associated protein Cas1 [Alicyclobacillus hesperidum URH17-3-68]|nr:CRISPR-associated protein Cas1 [Alicyclobacillus hesperidum URH17-3-68]KRW91534.1 hypothetical protein SD51_08630 [Alicyclobacillus tengchongensis]